MQSDKALANQLKERFTVLANELMEELSQSGGWSPKTRRIYINLALPPAPRQNMVSVQVVYRIERTVRSPRELLESDWRFIVSLPWTSAQKRVIQKLREQNNTPIHRDEISALLGRPFAYGAEASFNKHFYNARGETHCYSLLRIGKYQTPQQDIFRIFKMAYQARRPKFS